jgi:virginiamycin B lyase
MWVTLVHSGQIARVSDDGAVAIFDVAPAAKPSIITAGPDGAMWFTCAGDDRIARISTDGEVRAYPLGDGSAPFGITAGPDGALWFTAMATGVVGRISVDGEITDETVVGGMPSMITTGPDGALWCTLNKGNAIARVVPGAGGAAGSTARASLTVRALPTPNAGPVGITATHDDAVWFTEVLADKLGRIPMNDAIQEIDLPGRPHAVLADTADGVWVSLWGGDQIARVSGDGDIVTMDLPAGSEPHGLAIGHGGALWVALESGFVLRLPSL